MVYDIDMARRQPALVTGEIYHVFNRGVEKRKIFLGDWDYKHFLESSTHYQIFDKKLSRKYPLNPKNTSHQKLVEILSYSLMPNHFHLLLKQTIDNGISTFMGRVQNSFTKYFNIKNDRVGHLFQGAFKAVRIENDEQLVHVSRYIHLNPLVSKMTGNIKNYRWSSYPIYIGKGNNEVISTKDILDLFPGGDYERFVLDQADYARSLEQLKHITLD